MISSLYDGRLYQSKYSAHPESENQAVLPFNKTLRKLNMECNNLLTQPTVLGSVLVRSTRNPSVFLQAWCA
jgi:hypothetical protein